MVATASYPLEPSSVAVPISPRQAFSCGPTQRFTREIALTKTPRTLSRDRVGSSGATASYAPGGGASPTGFDDVVVARHQGCMPVSQWRNTATSERHRAPAMADLPAAP